MSATRIIIGGIIFIQAFFLFYSPVERFNFHQFFRLVKKTIECECLSQWDYNCIQQVRYLFVALMFTGVYSLFFKSNVWVAFFAQIFWMFTQSKLLYNFDILKLNSQLLNILFQILILINLFKELREQVRQYCNNCCNQKNQQVYNEQAKKEAQQLIQQWKVTLEQQQSQQIVLQQIEVKQLIQQQQYTFKKQKSQQIVLQPKQSEKKLVQQEPKNVNKQQVNKRRRKNK